jgi:hypothetical protein
MAGMPSGGFAFFVVMFGGMFSAGLVWSLAFRFAQAFVDRRRCRSNLRRLGHCQTCGYDLTGNQSGVCPECGALVREAS